jgi:hypothetical protein
MIKHPASVLSFSIVLALLSPHVLHVYLHLLLLRLHLHGM